jgi:hypothetical protein
MKRAILTFLFLVIAVTGARAQQVQSGSDNRRILNALRLEPEDELELDGALTEPIWRRAEPADGFVQIEPDNGTPASEPTEVRIVFDTNRMVIGVMAYDSDPSGIKGNQMQRDQPFSSDDRFMWSIDTYLDERSGYFFEINPSGAMGDGIIGGGGGVGGGRGAGSPGPNNKAWDGIWTARVTRHAEGWSAEVEIPFKTLNFDPNSQAWGINFQRTLRRKNEESRWNGFARNRQLNTMSEAGLVVGITEISQGLGLDVKPYFVGRATVASMARP